MSNCDITELINAVCGNPIDLKCVICKRAESYPATVKGVVAIDWNGWTFIGAHPICRGCKSDVNRQQHDDDVAERQTV